MRINLQVQEHTLSAESNQTIVSQNAGYTLLVTFMPDITGQAYLEYTFEKDGKNVTGEIELNGELEIPALPTCYGAHLRVRVAPDSGEEYITNELWIPVANSIKSQQTESYEAPFDAYNAIMRYLNSTDAEEKAAITAQLSYHADHPAPFPGIAYKRAIKAATRYTRLHGTITPANSGSVRQFTDDDIKGNTLEIATNAVSGDVLLPGGVPTAKMAITFLDGDPDSMHDAEIAPVFEIALETGRWFQVPLGVFTAASETTGSASGVSIIAYDDMKRLDDIPASDLGFEDFVGYSPGQIIGQICSRAGIAYTEHVDHDARLTGRTAHSYICILIGDPDDTYMQGYVTVIRNAEDMTPEEIQAQLDDWYLGTVTYRGDVNYPNELPAPGEGVELLDAFRVGYDGPLYKPANTLDTVKTARDLLMHTVGTLTGIAQISADRHMVIIPITAVEQTTDAELINTNQTSTRQISRYPYRLHEAQTVIDYYPQKRIKKSVEWEKETEWLDGVTVEMPTNAMYHNMTVGYATINTSDRVALIGEQIERLVQGLSAVEFHPMQISMTNGDPTLGLLDWIRTDDTHTAPITSKIWRYKGVQAISACGADTVAGAIRTQASKQLRSDKLGTSESIDETLRQAQLDSMRTYAGLGGVSYRTVEMYTYAELEGKGE